MAEVDVPVVALLAKRTFWEKATILHAEYFRAHDKALPDRYSRHYYDVAMMAKGPIKAEAVADLPLVAQVVKHKETFYLPRGLVMTWRVRGVFICCLPTSASRRCNGITRIWL